MYMYKIYETIDYRVIYEINILDYPFVFSQAPKFNQSCVQIY